METFIAHARKQFDQILSYIQGDAQHQQLNEVEKGIFSALLKLGLTLLIIFFQQKGIGNRGKVHIDKDGTKRRLHSVKHKEYLSIFGKISIKRACYWKKGCHEIYPLDAELNLPDTEYSYVLQEWSAALGAEESYEKAAHFLGSILEMPLWGSSMETIMRMACVDVASFYKERQRPNTESEKEILVATMDGKGIIMRPDQLEKKSPKKRPRRARKLGERKAKTVDDKNDRPGTKKMSTVIGVYTIDPHDRRTAESFLDKKEIRKRPSPYNKVIQATLKGKEEAANRLKQEIEKRDPKQEKQGVALVDGEHKLRKLIKNRLPWFVIIIDIYHVMEYLWKGAHVYYKEGSTEAACWMADKLTKMLLGKVEEVIAELKEQEILLPKGKSDTLRTISKYLENGKEHMRYDIYLAKGYPVGSGVVEGACKNLVKDRMEQCGMRWTIAGAEAVLEMRSIQINGMKNPYWQYHITQEKKRLYEAILENKEEALAA